MYVSCTCVIFHKTYSDFRFLFIQRHMPSIIIIYNYTTVNVTDLNIACYSDTPEFLFPVFKLSIKVCQYLSLGEVSNEESGFIMVFFFYTFIFNVIYCGLFFM